LLHLESDPSLTFKRGRTIADLTAKGWVSKQQQHVQNRPLHGSEELCLGKGKHGR